VNDYQPQSQWAHGGLGVGALIAKVIDNTLATHPEVGGYALGGDVLFANAASESEFEPLGWIYTRRRYFTKH
jgi:hypothetical protein